MAIKGGGSGSSTTSGSNNNSVNPGSGNAVSLDWHIIVLWFLGALALVGLAGPAPKAAIWVTVILVGLVLLKNWSTYASYLGIKA